MSLKPINHRGQVFGWLTVAGWEPGPPGGRGKWKCVCRCGNIIKVTGSNLRNGSTKSCGCLHKIQASQRMKQWSSIINSTHGHTRERLTTPTYNSWKAMKSRCYRKTDARYNRYGGRGIRICKRWFHSFEQFLNDMGERPPRMTLDRINPDGHYTLNNCRWADAKTQRRNRSKLNKGSHDD